MNTKFFVDENSALLGGFGDGAQPPEGAIEVPEPPHGEATWTGSEWVMPPAPVPASITFAQLLIGLVAEQWITEVDGEGWLTGTLPTAVLAVIDTLPVEQRFAAKARALRPSEVLRNDPLVQALSAAAGKTSEELDNFFRTYSEV